MTAGVRLEPLSGAAFQQWYEHLLIDYAAEKVRSGNWTEAEAGQRALEEIAEILPLGESTPNQWVNALINIASGEQVGILWYASDKGRAKPIIWVYDLLIFEPYRRRGFAQQALRCLEEEARSLGFDRIELHVFGHNLPAQALYAKTGYVSTNIVMGKDLYR